MLYNYSVCFTWQCEYYAMKMKKVVKNMHNH